MEYLRHCLGWAGLGLAEEGLGLVVFIMEVLMQRSSCAPGDGAPLVTQALLWQCQYKVL
jgi:hypothetical protein